MPVRLRSMPAVKNKRAACNAALKWIRMRYDTSACRRTRDRHQRPWLPVRSIGSTVDAPGGTITTGTRRASAHINS